MFFILLLDSDTPWCRRRRDGPLGAQQGIKKYQIRTDIIDIIFVFIFLVKFEFEYS
jgi:hypothetical protein